MSVFLTAAQVARFHDLQTPEPLRDVGLLEGAVDRCQAGWGNTFLYPSVEEQAAVLLISICQAQAFVDGNKRTAWVACHVFLGLNSRRIRPVSDGAILDLMQRISTHKVDEAGVATWLRKYTARTRP